MKARSARRARGRVLLILLPAVLLLAGGGAAYFFLLRPKSPKPPPPKETYDYQLHDLTVNLADEQRPHYLNTSVGLVIAGVAPEDTVQTLDAQIRDAVIMVITQHTYGDLLTAEGKKALKDNIKSAVDQVLHEDKLAVEDVLFTAFVMD